MPKTKAYKSFVDEESTPSRQSALADEWIESSEDDEPAARQQPPVSSRATEKEPAEAKQNGATTLEMEAAPRPPSTAAAASSSSYDDASSIVSVSRRQLTVGIGFTGILVLIVITMLSGAEPPSPPPLPPQAPNPPAQPPPPWERFWMRPSPPPHPEPPPPPPSPPPPGSVAQVMAELNARYDNGRASNDLREVGVLVHTFDAVDDTHSMRDDLWNPCPEDSWCHDMSDRISASLINRRLPHVFRATDTASRYDTAHAGFVLDAATLQLDTNASVFCSWVADAGTMGMRCDPGDSSCMPGCRSGFQCGQTHGSNYCWFPRDQLHTMVETHLRREHTDSTGCGQRDCNYNEVMLSSDFWTAHLPHAVQAIFFPANSTSAETMARRVRTAFIQAFDMRGGRPPLVRYTRGHLDPSQDDLGRPAFELVEPHFVPS